MQNPPSDEMSSLPSCGVGFPPVDERRLLEELDETGNKWVWSDVDKGRWEEFTDIGAMGVYQQFYDHWRDSPSKFRDTSTTYTLSLMDPDIESKLSISPKHTTGNKILVTRAYEDMHHRLLRLRGNDKGRTQGVVITGQPGIGKTTFLGFMLARLISAKQIVVLCNSTKVLLFYCGRVYSQEASLGFRGLPINQHNAQYCPIWALVDSRKGGPNIIRSSNIWPIQTSSPNPDRWKEWRKQNGAVVLGMPLWDTDDLVKG